MPQPATQGRRTDLKAEDARKAALQARLRTAGIPITPESLKAAVAPDFGHDVGLCIRATIKGDEATQAWDAFSHLSASYRNYMTLFIGQTGNPKCAAIAMIPEPMETDPSLRVDLRTHDERVRAAIPVTVRGETFTSLRTCAKHFGISVQAVHDAVKRGKADMIGSRKRTP